MLLQHDLLPLISRLRQATERQDWMALAQANLHLARRLPRAAPLHPTDAPAYESLCDAHVLARQAADQAQRNLQGEVWILQSMLHAFATGDSR